jgi:MarR family transcriptional regulator, lower aerobic nicotinate degradation pathway regulator
MTTISEPSGQAEPAEGHVAAAISRLAAISRRLMKLHLATEDWVTSAGLRPRSFGVMTCIAECEPVSQKQISDRLGLDPSDLVSVIDVLEEAGFVLRVRDQDDRRRYALTLTPAGRGALSRLEALAAVVQDEMLAPLDADDRAMFLRLVHEIVAHHATIGASPRAG